ncbi:epidermal growth factor receptor substrate 15-like 1 isoform X3 [Phyllopteryx taeniolatus]|uniref:epidermal growth factor receptor substrate 15-like 1 isoform X3 n=1 Tax=Phyllopteryx taeniolatus TaxID=161469 RepID=UPI002AD3E573|nr:epidermal growth factor receptor substrate 15-like 1 isoform X3 [Phyllopteryx taeniolatus]
MAALMTLSQLSSGNPVYENYYRQLDPVSSGKILAGDAAQFLKKSGLSDNTLGKIWDLADSERKGYLDKRGFFIALRLVALAQAGHNVSLSNLTQTEAPPKFRDTSSPLLSTPASDAHWSIRPDEKGKFEGIFESLTPVKGFLSGDKVKPILINSKLPLDVLGKIWDLGDADKDGYLDKEEFIVVMHLVYRAMEKEPVPAVLPPSLIPPSKRKRLAGTMPGAVAVLPSRSASFALKDSTRSTSPLASASPFPSPTAKLTSKHSFKASIQPEQQWVVPVADRERYNDLFKKTDMDNDGLIDGTEVIEIFMHSSLSQTMLAQIWGLADTKQTGKLTQEQFSLAMHLIHQKITKDIDPPTSLTPDMIPPSERTTAMAASSAMATAMAASSAALPDLTAIEPAELTGIKELDDLSQEISQLQREKLILQHQLKEKEETIRRQSHAVQNMQHDLDRESSSLQDIESQKQDAQQRLDVMDQQHSKLEGMLNDVKQKFQEESQTISTLQSQIRSQESELRSQEKEVNRTKADLGRLQDEEAQLEQSLQTGHVQLDSIIKSLKTTQEEISQARSKLSLIQENQKEFAKTIEQYNSALRDLAGGNNMAATSHLLSEKENGAFKSVVVGILLFMLYNYQICWRYDYFPLTLQDESFKSRIAMFNTNAAPADPFQMDDPFKPDPFNDPFRDPFRESDHFKGTSSDDLFSGAVSSDPFAGKPKPPVKPGSVRGHLGFSSSSPKPKHSESVRMPNHLFAGNSLKNNTGFPGLSQLSKKSDNPVLPSKKSVPNRPAPPYGSDRAPKDGPASFGSESQQLEWAKRESEREEHDRLRRLRLQEQQDLELAIALSRAEAPSS